MDEKTAMGILAVVSIFAAGGMFLLQDADTSVSAQAVSSYYFLTSGDSQSIPPNKMFDIRGYVPSQCQTPTDCPEGYDCKNVKFDQQYMWHKQEQYQKKCIAIE